MVKRTPRKALTKASASTMVSTSDFNRASDEDTKFGAVTTPVKVAPDSAAFAAIAVS